MDKPTVNGATRFDGGKALDGRHHGQAALLLVESLMHTLVDNSIISREDFVDTVEGAAEVEHELVNSNASSPRDPSGSLLQPLAAAFRKELGR